MEQSTALNILKSGKNVFLTGSAGTGKSHTLKQYVQYLKQHRIPVAITASTGIAASQLNGTTIHAWSGIGVKQYLTQRDVNKVKNNVFKGPKIQKTKVLIIDEISMLHLRQLELVDTMLRQVREIDEPFGGIQLVLTGDFFQLPPVGSEGEKNNQKFCFMSPAWAAADLHVCYLDKQYRQTEGDLSTVLNAIRSQSVTPEQVELIRDTEFNTELSEKPLHLFTHNLNVDVLNDRSIRELEGELKVFTATEKGPEYLLKTLKASVRAPENLELKIGAKVMFVKNHPEGLYSNGSQGTVMKYMTVDGKLVPFIKLLNGSEVLARPEDWSIDDEHGKPLAVYSQVPLRLAYAITVHKSQGMTLQEAEIDLSRTFEMGQGYVALSRLQSIEGLRLTGLHESALLLDPLALKADKRFQELSSQIEPNFVTANSIAERNFIQQCRRRRRSA